MSDTTRIALFIPSLCYGGAERQVIEIARHLDRRRFEVHIILLIDYTPLLDDGDELLSRVHVLGRSRFIDPGLVVRLVRVLLREGIQIVHSFLFLPEITARLARLARPKTVVLGSERNTSYHLAFYRWLCLRMTSRLCRLVVANSSAGAAFNARYFSQPREKYRVVCNGVDTDRFRPGDKRAARQALGLREDAVIVGMFASFKRQKNHPYLFDALGRIDRSGVELILLLVGDTLVLDHDDTQDYKAEVQASLRMTGLDKATTILGNRVDVEALYPACDFTVLPSTHEGTPNVVLESMACGVPAIVTDVSDNASLVTHGVDGLVVPVDNVDDLKAAIERLMKSPDERDAFGSAARATTVSKFSVPTMVDNLARIYGEFA